MPPLRGAYQRLGKGVWKQPEQRLKEVCSQEETKETKETKGLGKSGHETVGILEDGARGAGVTASP